MKVHTKFIQAFGALLIAALLFAALPAGAADVSVRFMAASGGRRVARLRLTLRAPNVGKARRGAQASGAGLEMDR